MAAHQVNRTHRFAQQAVQAGDLPALRMVGRTTVVDDIAVRAWSRSLARGRTWSPEVRDAALDLLSTGTTERLSSSERSRLRRRLRAMTATAIAHASGGLDGAWARYRSTDPIGLQPIGPSVVDLESFGILPTSTWITFIQVADLDLLEQTHPVVLDADGNLCVIERTDQDDRIARVLIDTYLLGDARESSAAATELEQRARDV